MDDALELNESPIDAGGADSELRSSGEKDKKETVLNAFNEASSAFNNFPEDQLTKDQLAARDLLKEIKQKTIDQNKSSYLNKFKDEDGKEYKQKEYLPVDHLIIFLRQRIESGELSEDEEKKYREDERILHRNSQEYYRGRIKKEYERKMGRIRQEAERISNDPRLTTGDPHQDFLKASQILFERREMIIPPDQTDPPPPPPPPPTPQEIMYEAAVINRTIDPHKRAREIAEDQLREAYKKGNIFQKIKLRVAEQYYRQIYIERATKAMLEHNNSYLYMDVVKNGAVDATNRLAEEKEAGRSKIESIKAGEKMEGQEVREASGPLKQTIINEILRPVIDGTVSSEADIQARLRQFVENHQNDPDVEKLFGRGATDYGRLAEYFATDLLEMGRKVKEDLEAHKYALDQIDQHIKIKLANTSWAAKTEAHKNWVDTAVAWTQKNKLRGWLVNPATIGAAASLVTFIGLRLGGRLSTLAHVAIPFSGMLFGGALAAGRRYHDINVDRAANDVDMTYSGRIAPNSPRREALEKFAYDRATVEDLLSRLSGAGTDRENVMRSVAEIKTRLDFSVREKVDLITYSGREQVEQGELQLIKAIVEAKNKLKDAGVPDDEIKSLETRFVGEWNQRFTQNREQQDRAFAGYRLRESFKAGAFGAATGLASGLLVQEGLALGTRALGGAAGHTVIEQGLEAIGIDIPTGHGGFNVEEAKDLFNNPGRVELGGGVTMVTDIDHKVSFLDSAGNPIDTPPIHISDSGSIVSSGTPDNLPDPIKNLVSAWEQKPAADTNFNIQEDLKEMAQSGRHDTFFHGDVAIDINSGPNGQMSMQYGDVQAHGFLQPDGTINLDKSFDGNASIPPDKWEILQNELKKNSWGVTVEAGTSTASIGEYLQQQGQLSPTNRDLWHHNDTPMRFINGKWFGADGKELLFYHRVLPDGRIELDFSKMESEFKQGRWTNWDYSVDNQYNRVVNDIVRQPDGSRVYNNFEMMFTPTEAENAGRMAYVVNPTTHPELAQGKLWFTPDSFEAKSFFSLDQNGQPIRNQYGNFQLTSYIEVAHMQPDGTRTILSTTQGLGDPINPPPLEKIHLEPPPATEFIPPGPPEAPPIIPIPFAPRWPLERLRERGTPLERTTPPYYGYFSLENLSPEDQEFYRNRFSERLRNNPDTNLDPAVEIPDYLNRQSPEYRRQLEEYLNQEGMREQMDEECDAVACIPVYDLGEGQVVEKALEQYLLQIDKARNQQAINPRKFELILFLNHPKPLKEEIEQRLGKPYTEGAEARVGAGKPEVYDTEEVIRQFRQRHPELRIRVMKQEFDQRPIWSNIIKPIYDIALLRASKRTNPFKKDPLIITNDVDVINMSPTYLRDILQTMDLNEIAASRNSSVKKIDGLAGKTDMPNQGYEKAPGFMASMRLWQYLNQQVQRGKNRVVITQGRNTVLRGSTYAAIGGVNNERGMVDAGSDTTLGRMIAFARGNPSTIEYLNRSWLITDPRREFKAWQNGTPLPWAWNEWGAMNVYGKDWKDRFGTKPQDPKKINKEFLQTEINEELKNWGLQPDSLEIKRALAYIGLLEGDYHIENGQIKVDKLSAKERSDLKLQRRDGVIEKLEKYVKEKRWEVTDRKKKQALEHPPVTTVDATPYAAEFLDYEEYDRVYSDIFVSREYPWHPDIAKQDPTIIDLGGHIGMSVLYWKTLRPNSKVTVVEANPKTAKVLRSNVKRNQLKDVKVIQAAASSQKGSVTLQLPKDDFRWGDAVAHGPVDPSRHDSVSVPTARLSELITGPVDLLKIDIEGAELEVLKEAEGKLPQVKEIMMEFHNDPVNNPTNTLDETLQLLTRQGFSFEVRQWNQPVNVAGLDLTQQTFLTILAKKP